MLGDNNSGKAEAGWSSAILHKVAAQLVLIMINGQFVPPAGGAELKLQEDVSTFQSVHLVQRRGLIQDTVLPVGAPLGRSADSNFIGEMCYFERSSVQNFNGRHGL